MKKYISKNFNTYKNRPIYFDESGEPWYGAIESGDYLSAIEAGPMMRRPIVKNPKPVESVVPAKNYTQDTPKSVYHDRDAIELDITTTKTKTKKLKKNSKIAKEKRKSSKTKHNKEYAFKKQTDFLQETAHEIRDEFGDYYSPSDFDYNSVWRYDFDDYSFREYDLDDYCSGYECRCFDCRYENFQYELGYW